MINKVFLLSWCIAALVFFSGSYIVVDSYSCDFKVEFPQTNLVGVCQQGVFQAKTKIEQGDERYKIKTKSVYIKILDKILLIPFAKDIDVEMKHSLAVYNAEKIKTPQRTFGNQPYTSMTLLRTPQGDILGVAVFSDPNSIYVPVKFITGTF